MSNFSRLLLFRKFLGMTQKQMAEILQVGQNTYSMIETGRIKLTDKNRNILVDRLGLNPQWYDTGDGDMRMDEPKSFANEQKDKSFNKNADSSSKGVPYFSEPINNTSVLSVKDRALRQPEYMIDYPPFNDCSFYRPLYGESMSPKFNSGDVVACKKIAHKDLILFGESYLCFIKMDGDFYETIKIIRSHKDNPDMVILKSANPKYDEITLPIESIVELYLIKGKMERCF